MTSLLHSLDLSQTLSIHDVYSITKPALHILVPCPAHVLLIVFPTSATYKVHRKAEDSTPEDYTGFGANEPVMWFHQMIGNSCGLMAPLPAAANSGAKDFIGVSPLNSIGTDDSVMTSSTPQNPLFTAVNLFAICSGTPIL